MIRTLGGHEDAVWCCAVSPDGAWISYFRGNLYSETIEHITGVYIGEEWIPPEIVRMMADGMARCDPPEVFLKELKESRGWEPCTPDELSDLTVFFRVCAEHGLGLVGS